VPSNLTPQDQVAIVLKLLEGRKLSRDSPVYAKALGWVDYVTRCPGEFLEGQLERLIHAICATFEVQKAEVFTTLSGVETPRAPAVVVSSERELESLLPKGGWFEAYVEYTRYTESPMSYHVFCSLAVLGAALGRRVYLPMGFFDVFPNYCVILIGPTGRVMKTSAVDIAKSFIKEFVLCPIMADKVTGEALATALVQSGHHFVYAPEFSVLFGKQRYNEGLTTLILRMLDCPTEWSVLTQTRQLETITNVALTILGGSTLSLLAGNTPTEVTSSGFLNRFVLVVEHDTERCFPIPQKGPKWCYAKIKEVLEELKCMSGEVHLVPAANSVYDEWYRERKKQMRYVASDVAVEVIQRGAIHVLRTATLTHMSHCGGLEVCASCMSTGIKLIEFAERRVPEMVDTLSKTAASQDTDYVLDALRRLGGASDHSSLLRRVSSRINARTLRQHIETLVERKAVKEERRGNLRFYVLREEESDANSA